MLTNDPYVAVWVMEKVGRYMPDMTALGEIKDGQFIAGVAFESQNKKRLWGHQRIDSPPSKSFWIAVAQFIFISCNCKAFSAIVDSTNTKAIELNKHIGFIVEATLHDAGDNGDLLIMTLYKENCRFLNWVKK
jgi:RimJ/RimL family protein N-acetyltransferase